MTFEYTSSTRTLYSIKNGKKAKVYKAKKGYTVQSAVLTDGKNIYFGIYNNFKAIFYRCTITGDNREKIVSVRASLPHIVGCYNGKIYYFDGFDELACLNISTGKTKSIYSDSELMSGSFAQTGKYIFFSSQKGICRYDLKSGGIKTLAKQKTPVTGMISLIYDSASGYIYYVRGIGNGVASVECCKTDGGNKKTLIKKMSLDEVKRLTNKSITYYYGGTGLLKTRYY